VKREDDRLLYENEVAVDLGGSCYGENGEERLIFDHHFSSPGMNIPSASSAVLRYAKELHDTILERVYERGAGARDIWIVTHQSPDFDALCASFLVEGIIDQNSAFNVPLRGWEELGIVTSSRSAALVECAKDKHPSMEIDWFNPPSSFAEDHRWPLLLAAYASRLDHCHPILCRRSEALHSVLYAAIVRRGPRFAQNGAHELFKAAIESIRNANLHPFYDSLFTNTPEFAPELRLLENESLAYRRDIARARKCVVHIQRSRGGFTSLLKQVEGGEMAAGVPLLTESVPPGRLSINPNHVKPFLEGSGNGSIEADGLFLRDPECLLFKEWARDTQEEDPIHGYVFTAIAYSKGRPEAPVNRTEYYFSLDPEKVPGAHLYNVWARLQCEEVTARRNLSLATEGLYPRPGFQNRSRGFEPWFSDPWFDGSNSDGTIVATPWLGTFIGSAGKLPDLSDDPVATIVAQELEYSVFQRSTLDGSPTALLQDFPLQRNANSLHAGRSPEVSLPVAIGAEVGQDCFRFARIALVEHIDLSRPRMAIQVGHILWAILSPPGLCTIPNDFETQHLTTFASSVVVWNRRGIAIAWKPDAFEYAGSLATHLSHLAGIALDIRILLSRINSNALDAGEALLRRIVELKIAAAKPDNRPLRHLMDAIRFDTIIESVHALNQQVISRKEAARATFLNLIIGLFALTFALPTLILTFFTVIHGPSEATIAITSIIPFAMGIVTGFWLYIRYRGRLKG
jgi:hypothetical protein